MRPFLIRLKHLFLLILFIMATSSHAAIVETGIFLNRTLNIDHFEFFFEDRIGQLWAGSFSDGLMRFNGETFVRAIPDHSARVGIRCSKHVKNNEYLIGTRSGLYHFDSRRLAFSRVEALGFNDVKSIEYVDDNHYLCFCEYSIISYDIRSGKTKELCRWKESTLSKQIAMGHDKHLILMNNRGLFVYKHHSNQLSSLPFQPFSRSEEFISFMFDGKWIWIGSNSRLYRYDFNRERTEIVPALNGHTIKHITRDSKGKLRICTNNGLYDLDDDSIIHYTHTTHNSKSILNDQVWCSYEDRYGNSWVGVDSGVSVIPRQNNSTIVNWAWDLPSESGNRILCMLHDSHNRYWMGGLNGISMHQPTTGMTMLFNVFGINHLPDNTIRCIYEDREGTIWIGTDGGLCFFNETTQQFVRCDLVDKATGHNAIYTYGIIQDLHGRMWIATCSGGIFCADRKQLMGGSIVNPLVNYHPNNCHHSIPSVNCSAMTMTENGDIWIQAGNDMCVFTKEMLNANEFPSRPTVFKDAQNIYTLIVAEGGVWGGNARSLFKATREGVAYEDVESLIADGEEIAAIAFSSGIFWLLTSSQLLTIDKKTNEKRIVLDFKTSLYNNLYYDRTEHKLWLCGLDHCLTIVPTELPEGFTEVDAHAILSEFYVNNTLITPLTEVNGHQILSSDITFTDKIVLANTENNIAFRFQTGTLFHGTEFPTGYHYRIRGLYDRWIPIRSSRPLVEYNYMPSGSYQLEIGFAGKANTIDVIRSIHIIIKAPWYHSWWFYLLLTVLFIVIVVAALNHYRLRTKYRIAEIDRKHTIALSKMKMDFVANMSHELKTPLTLVMGSVNHLLSSMKSSPARQEVLVIKENANRMSSVITQIINYKGVAESSQLVKVKMEIVEFARSICNTFREAMPNRNISFSSSAEPLYIDVDPMKLESILNNLLSNACKFTPTDKAIRVGVKTKENQVLLFVEDEGTGISAADLPHIFDRFYQASQHQELNPSGTGIGLAVVKEYVEQFGGTITVISEQGCGSSFTVALPLLPGSEKTVKTSNVPLKPIHQDTPAPGILRVLVVEDNIEIANYIASGLVGMQCTVTHNGKSGFDMALQSEYDIIVADIMMPIMDGETMSRQLKCNLTTRNIPIILLTAKDDKRTELNAYKNGVDAFMAKPFDIKELTIRIRQLVESHRVQSVSQPASFSSPESSEQLPVHKSLDERFMDELNTTIETHLDDSSLSVKSLAEMMHVSEKQLYRRTKQLTGKTVVEYVKNIRMKHAAVLLSQQGRFSVKEVAFITGFTSQSYFTKVFTDTFGKTPTEYAEG